MTDKRTLKSWISHGIHKLPLSISCEEFEDFILAYLEGELTRRQKFIFNTHLKICAECRAYLAAYQASISLGKAAFDKTDAPAVPEGLVQAILAARSPGK